jgi:hypothetical protein
MDVWIDIRIDGWIRRCVETWRNGYVDVLMQGGGVSPAVETWDEEEEDGGPDQHGNIRLPQAEVRSLQEREVSIALGRALEFFSYADEMLGRLARGSRAPSRERRLRDRLARMAHEAAALEGELQALGATNGQSAHA